MDKFVYEAPYVIKTGKHQGKRLEDLFFTEAGFFIWFANKEGAMPYPLWQHIKFLIEAFKKLETKMLCPICNKNRVKFFYLLPKSVLALKYTSCDNQKCRTAIESRYTIERTFPINFESLKELPRKDLMDHAGRLFKNIYGLPRFLKEDTTFNLFKETDKPELPVKPKKRKIIKRLIDGSQLNIIF